jgi:hypothetical protein
MKARLAAAMVMTATAAGVLGTAAPASAGTDIDWFQTFDPAVGKARFLSATDTVEVCDLKADGREPQAYLYRDPTDFYSQSPYISIRVPDGSKECVSVSKDILEGQRVVVMLYMHPNPSFDRSTWKDGYA